MGRLRLTDVEVEFTISRTPDGLVRVEMAAGKTTLAAEMSEDDAGFLAGQLMAACEADDDV